MESRTDILYNCRISFVWGSVYISNLRHWIFYWISDGSIHNLVIKLYRYCTHTSTNTLPSPPSIWTTHERAHVNTLTTTEEVHLFLFLFYCALSPFQAYHLYKLFLNHQHPPPSSLVSSSPLLLPGCPGRKQGPNMAITPPLVLQHSLPDHKYDPSNVSKTKRYGYVAGTRYKPPSQPQTDIQTVWETVSQSVT